MRIDKKHILYHFWFMLVFSIIVSPVFGGEKKAPQVFRNSLGMDFVLVSAGSFSMGADEKMDSGEFAHEVEITRSYYIGKYEVTQEQWEAVMGYNPSSFKGPNRPVENISFEEVLRFIKKLNKMEGTDMYRLPTEAEWEYAARFGTEDAESPFDHQDTSIAGWFDDNSGFETHPVGTNVPNAIGIFDMLGNVAEWCQDWFDRDYYFFSDVRDPKGPESGYAKVYRGGSWDSDASSVSPFQRYSLSPKGRSNTVGFRLAKTIEKQDRPQVFIASLSEVR